jgi:hypothetical protein
LAPIAVRFLNNPETATYWLIVIFIWQYLGFSSSLFSLFRTTGAGNGRGGTWTGRPHSHPVLNHHPNIRSGIMVLVSLLLISSLKVFDSSGS